VGWRSDLRRALHFQLISHNITSFGRNGIKKLDGRQLRALLSHPHDRQAGGAILRLIAAVDREVARLDEQIASAVFRKRPIVRLKTIPGIGKILAATICFEVGQIHRFASDKAFASYCRVAPMVAQSGAISRQGRNRKQGNRLLKKKRKRILGKSILAHKLAVAAFHVLKEERSYQARTLPC
jgi:transposase